MLIGLRFVFVVSLIVLMTGCATQRTSHLDFEDQSSVELSLDFCRNWSEQLDVVIAQYDARDFGATKVKDYVYLRADRFLAAFSDLVYDDPNLFRAWVSAMVDLDQESRQIEVNNLNDAALRLLGKDRLTIKDVTKRCSVFFKEHYLEEPFDDLEKLTAVVFIPDDYSSVKRALGLYPLLKIPFIKGIKEWHKQARDTFERYAQKDVKVVSTRQYEPTKKSIFRLQEVARLMSQRDALGQLTLSPDLLSRLFVTYAPIFTIEDSGEFDRVGAVDFTKEGAVTVNVLEPTVYTHLTHTRFEGRTLPQLVYVAWFLARPKEGVGDLLGGNLDGIIWRVTLDHDGTPLLFDSIHPCGCYHMFFPTDRLVPNAAPSEFVEWAFSPKQLNEIETGMTVNITVQTKTHYLAGVTLDNFRQEAQQYSLRAYDELRSIETSQGRRNLFGVNGIVSGSERGERYLLWPSGIESPGAMRQWGRHATAFVGRRHFDDVDLLDKYYIRR